MQGHQEMIKQNKAVNDQDLFGKQNCTGPGIEM